MSCLSVPLGAEARETDFGRELDVSAFDVGVEHYALPNGATVVLSPDPDAEGIYVELVFASGALDEPPKRSGLAHLAEHFLALGTDPAYPLLAEARGAWHFNATTGPEFMSFELGLPAEELPFALWSVADRLGRGLSDIPPAELEREREVVRVECSFRQHDRPYAVANRIITARLFPEGHAFHGLTCGHPEDLDAIQTSDLATWVESQLVPANATLIVTGRFEPKTARDWIERTLGRVPARSFTRQPRVGARHKLRPEQLAVRETWSRKPRVSLVWQFEDISPNDYLGLSLGALALRHFLDGSFGSRVAASTFRIGTDGVFQLDVQMPYDKPVPSALGEAEVFLRYLTGVDLPRDYFDQIRNLMDRHLVEALEHPLERAQLLRRLVLDDENLDRVAEHLSRHWRLERNSLRQIAWRRLVVGAKPLIVHARPVRPLQPRLPRELRGE